MRERRALFLFAVATSGAAAVVAVACGTDTIYVVAPSDAGNDSAAARDAKKPPTTGDDDDFAPSGDDDATTAPPKDAGKDARADARAAKDANGAGAADAECSFNSDCQLALRCACDGTCACAAGARGKNVLGATCDAGTQCVNGLCIEGPTTSSDYLCSDECETPVDCPAKLPRCEKVSFVGRICVRQP